MDWYYTTQSDEQVGPVDESQIKQLVSTGTITPATSVWNESMDEWQPAGNTDLKAQFPQRKTPPPVTKKPTLSPIVTPTDVTDSFARDPQKVYPSNPPKSPHLCWINMVMPGLAQIMHGQVAKGFAILGATMIGTMLFAIPGLLIWGASFVDAFMTGRVLEQGRPVGKWQLFPTA